MRPKDLIGVEKSGIGPGKAPANPADDLVGDGISYGGEGVI